MSELRQPGTLRKLLAAATVVALACGVQWFVEYRSRPPLPVAGATASAVSR